MPKHPKPNTSVSGPSTLTISGALVHGGALVATLDPAPPDGKVFLWLDIRSADGGAQLGWVSQAFVGGRTSQTLGSPTWQSGPASGSAFAGDGLSTDSPLSDTISFTIG